VRSIEPISTAPRGLGPQPYGQSQVLFAIPILLLGCSRDAPGESSQVAAPLGTIVPSAASLPILLAGVRQAASHGRSVAYALPYPITVNTMSGCNATLDDPRTFSKYENQIVTGKVREALLSDKEPIHYQRHRAMLGSGAVWYVQEANKARVTLNVATWKLPGLLCLNENPLVLGHDLDGPWLPSSVCQITSKVVVAARLTRLTIDSDQLVANVTSTTVGDQACEIDRFSEIDYQEGIPSEALHCSVGDGTQRGRALTLRCGGRAVRVFVRTDQLSLYSLDESQFIRLRRESRREHALDTGQPCGSVSSGCKIGLICDASNNAHEICRPLGTHLD
jgi:hypothetical protein